MIGDQEIINVKNKLDFLYQSIDFDPKLYKKSKNFIMLNEEKREICKELCQF